MYNTDMGIKEEIFDMIEAFGEADSQMLTHHFNISRQMVNRYLKALVKEGRIYKAGRTKGSLYLIRDAEGRDAKTFTKIYEMDSTAEIITGDFLAKADVRNNCNKNCFALMQFVLYALIDNVIKYAQSPMVQIVLETDSHDMEITVIDSGIGILQSIKEKHGLPHEADALFHINLPFSGFEFYDSEIVAPRLMTIIMLADQFTLQSHHSLMEKWDRDNSGILECEFFRGTRIRFIISKNTKKKLEKFIVEDY